MLELYTNIKKFRKLRSMTQDELAKRTGYTDRSSIAKIERGDVDLPQSKIMMFADALGVTAGTLMGNSGIVNDESTAIHIPVYDRVAAGIPIEALENIVDYEEIPESWPGEYAAVRVKGDSMAPRIQDGDVIIVRIQSDASSGDIVVALLEDSVTVKRFYKEDDHIRLQPENDDYEPIICTDCEIVGKVYSLYRPNII